ncbi:MAG: NAD(P)/FAD-dependent oxidoreductase [Myxococcota bacterium]|nr:NAD(P)/FAD-dependent oxidoreductase [Myxococcota bacterium]
MSTPPVVVLGAGPAGLAAARELNRVGMPVRTLERAGQAGGLCRTVEHHGYRFDIGGHRFFTKFPRVQKLWTEVLGQDLLTRPRLSRILYGGNLYDYPLQGRDALSKLGLAEASRCMASYGRARLRSHEQEDSFEQWVSNRFGDRLFEIFFRTYTEKVWGIPCSQISADWASQRIKNLSLGLAVRSALVGQPSQGEVPSLIEEFLYPRRGPGMMYDAMTEQLQQAGSPVELNTTVTRVLRDGNRVTAVEVRGPDGESSLVEGSFFLSSIPLTVLVQSFDPPPPPQVLEAVRSLSFRHLISVNLILEGTNLFPDNWVYVHAPELQVARIQNYGNWSPEMVPEPGRSAIGLEYFASDTDPLWSASDTQLLELGHRELASTGLAPVRQAHPGLVVRAPRAYPVYRRGYEQPLATLTSWLQRFENLQPMGRYGMFKYNNSDHSILTALLSVDNLQGAEHDIWSVNTDSDYLESFDERALSRRTGRDPENLELR